MTRPVGKSKKKPAKTLATPKAPTKRSDPVDTAPATIFAPRARISHRTFGPGIVQSVDGDKLEIKFGKVPPRCLAWVGERSDGGLMLMAEHTPT